MKKCRETSIKVLKHGIKYIFPIEKYAACPECKYSNNVTDKRVVHITSESKPYCYVRFECPRCGCIFDVIKKEAQKTS